MISKRRLLLALTGRLRAPCQRVTGPVSTFIDNGSARECPRVPTVSLSTWPALNHWACGNSMRSKRCRVSRLSFLHAQGASEKAGGMLGEEKKRRAEKEKTKKKTKQKKQKNKRTNEQKTYTCALHDRAVALGPRRVAPRLGTDSMRFPAVAADTFLPASVSNCVVPFSSERWITLLRFWRALR